jgi:hypothetical protein
MLGMGSNVSLQHVFPIFRVEMMRVRIQPGYIGRMARNVVTQKLAMSSTRA